MEVVRSLAEEAGGLAQVGKRTLPRHVFAGGVQSVVRRRLSRAPEWARPLLKLAAVAGRRIDRKVLSAVEPELARWLQCLSNAAILDVSDAEWRFAHDKLREGVLDALADDERCALHQQVGRLIEEVYGQQGPHVGLLAYHFEEARELPKAAHYLSMAGGQAMRRGAVKEAVELLRRALPLQEQTGAPLLERAATLRRLARAQYGIGQVDECLKATKDAMTVLGRSLPRTRLGRLWGIARETAVEVHNRIVGPRLVFDPNEQAMAREFLSLLRSTGETLFVTKIGFDEVTYIMLCGLHAAESIADRAELVNYLGYFGFVAYSLPLHRLGNFYLQIARDKLHLAPPRLSLGTFYAMASYVYFAETDWDAAVDAQQRWLDTVLKGGDDPQQGLIRITRAAVFVAMGRIDDAYAEALCAEQLGARIGNPSLRAYGLFWQAMVLRLRGDLARTQALLDEIEDVVSTRNTRFMDIMMIHSARGDMAARLGDLSTARKLLDDALSRLSRALAPTPQFLDGYYATVEGALLLVEKSQDAAENAEDWQRLRRALWQIARFSLKFPIAQPRALSGLGRALLLRKQKLPALACFSSSLHRARTMRMPYEQGLALLWLGRAELSVQGAAASFSARSGIDHLREAAQLFQSLGAASERNQAEAALAEQGHIDRPSQFVSPAPS